MREALVKVVDNKEEGGYPKNKCDFYQAPADSLKQRIRTLEEWGFDSLVLFGDDCFFHYDIWDICDYATDVVRFEEVYLMTRGRAITSSDLREIYQKEVSVIVPVDFYNPYDTSEIFGYNNYSSEAMGVLQRTKDSSVWQTIHPEMLEKCGQIIKKSAEFGSKWKGFVMEDIGMPEETPEIFRAENVEIQPPSRWGYYNAKDDPTSMEEWVQGDIFGKGYDYTGSIYVDEFGRVHNFYEDSETEMSRIGRNDLERVLAR